MAQPLDIVVDGRILLDVGVRLGDVRLGLVVVVVRDEVLDRVVGKHFPKLVRELSRQSLVRRHHQSRALQLLDQPRSRGRLTGTGRTEEDYVLLPLVDPFLQLGDSCRLIACRFVRADDLEARV